MECGARDRVRAGVVIEDGGGFEYRVGDEVGVMD